MFVKHTNMGKQRTIIHVELKAPHDGRRNWYFGSSAAIYDTLSPDVVGIGLNSLWNVFCKSDTYHGSLATIRKRELKSKVTNRGKKTEV